MALVAVSLCVALALGEGALQILDVEIRAERIVRDPILGWRNRPGWRGSTYGINSRGCLGPEFAAAKPEGVIRILCLGDSCTAGDLLPNFADTYPQQLREELARRYPQRSFEVINAAVGGYSSFQGRVWLERELIDFEPDVLVVYFGWNDHWPARSGGQDHVVSGSAGERVRAWLAWSKVLQLGVKAYHVAFGRRVVPAGEGRPGLASGRPPRVSREDYRANLERMVELVRERGGRTVLITAPNYLELVENPEETLPGEGVAAALVRVHASYCEAVRDVAREKGACLVDAARLFEADGQPEVYFRYPVAGGKVDFIHMRPVGYGKLAAAVAASDAVREAVEAP